MKFLTEDDQLIITLEGAEVFFAVKRKLVLTRAMITDLQWRPELTLDQRLWRFGGADIPRRIWAGRFYGGGKRYFLYLLRPPGFTWSRQALQLQNTLDITLQDNFYQEILLTCGPDIGAGLLNWWRSGI